MKYETEGLWATLKKGKMAEVPKALEDCLWQSMQWQWKSMMGLGVGVVYLTAPQAHEPFITMLMFVYKKFKDEACFSWRGDVAPRESYPTTSWHIMGHFEVVSITMCDANDCVQ
jgi:hypothetical protein